MPSKRAARIAQVLSNNAGSAGRPATPESAALEEIASEVDLALRPVRPRSSYRSALRHDLVLTAQNKISPYLVIQNPFERQRLIMLGALIGSALSVIGGIIAALLVRARMLQHRAEQR
jgi:hypothetical protein